MGFLTMPSLKTMNPIGMGLALAILAVGILVARRR